MTAKIYGIKNCDTMKKTFTWFEQNNIPYTFINYREQGIDAAKIEEWLTKLDASVLVNTKSTTFKQLTDEEKQYLTNTPKLVQLLVGNPTMIKRPLVEINNNVMVGYKPDDWK
jgi:arsenate reductase